jgi:hypothetical protein
MTPKEQHAFGEALAKVLDGIMDEPDDEIITETRDLLTDNQDFLALAAACAENLIKLAGYEQAPTMKDAFAREPEDPFVVTHADILSHIISMLHMGMVLGSKLADLGIRVKDREVS